MSVRRFAYVPGIHFDVWSFEIKPQWQTNVVGVFEAAAHSRFATRSYVMYHIEPTGDPVGTGALEACIREADRFNIGLVTFVDPRDFKTWGPQRARAPRSGSVVRRRIRCDAADRQY